MTIHRNQPKPKGGNMLTAREEWILEGKMEGEMKGEMKGQIFVINNLLSSNFGFSSSG